MSIEQTNVSIRDRLILSICSICDSHVLGCDGCPILNAINEAFDEVGELIREGENG